MASIVNYVSASLPQCPHRKPLGMREKLTIKPITRQEACPLVKHKACRIMGDVPSTNKRVWRRIAFATAMCSCVSTKGIGKSFMRSAVAGVIVFRIPVSVTSCSSQWRVCSPTSCFKTGIAERQVAPSPPGFQPTGGGGAPTAPIGIETASYRLFLFRPRLTARRKSVPLALPVLKTSRLRGTGIASGTHNCYPKPFCQRAANDIVALPHRLVLIARLA
jgi:hypothetical protein